MFVCAAFPTYKLLYSFEKWQELSGENGTPDKNSGWCLPGLPTLAALLPFNWKSAPLLRTYCDDTFLGISVTTVLFPFVSLQLLPDGWLSSSKCNICPLGKKQVLQEEVVKLW